MPDTSDMNLMDARFHNAERPQLIGQAFHLEWLTIAWMVIEAAVASGSALAAHSTSLLAFGVDSLIELASASVLIWRLSVELKHGREFSEAAERRAGRIAGALLFVLAAYVLLAAAWALWRRQGEDFSTPGLIVTLLAIPLMYALGKRKIALSEELRSPALRADGVEAFACAWLAFVVVIGLLAQLALNAWWIDSATSVAVLWFLIKEGREAWEVEGHCDD